MSSEAVAPPELQSAGIWRRFMSMVYEGIMLFGVLFFFSKKQCPYPLVVIALISLQNLYLSSMFLQTSHDSK